MYVCMWVYYKEAASISKLLFLKHWQQLRYTICKSPNASFLLELIIVVGIKRDARAQAKPMHVPKWEKKKHVNLRWCYTRRFATPIFSATLCNIVATLVWMTAILFQQSSFAWPHVDLARPPRRKKFRLFWIISFEFAKDCWIRFSSRESFIGCIPDAILFLRS